MPSIGECLRAIVDTNLQVEDRTSGQPLDLDSGIVEAGLSSTDAMALWRLINEEFGVTCPRRSSPSAPLGNWLHTWKARRVDRADLVIRGFRLTLDAVMAADA